MQAQQQPGFFSSSGWLLCCYCLLLPLQAVSAALDTAALHGLADTHYHKVESTDPAGSYHLYVRLPEGYADSHALYPTVYLLDGGVTFPALAGYYRYLLLGEEVPPLIIVGIAYGSEDWREGNQRSRDFTVAAANRDHWGGAARFHALLRDKLLPLVESNYRADPAARILFGQSIGGQFVLYAARQQPVLFNGLIASNPALHRNLDYFLQPWPTADGKLPRTRLFFVSAENDEPRFREPALRWIQHWQAVAAKDTLPFELHAITLAGHGHFSALPASFRQGLRWLLPAQ